MQLPDPGDGEEHTHVEEFDFADLRFIKSSRMSKRRLAFVLQLQARHTGRRRRRPGRLMTPHVAPATVRRTCNACAVCVTVAAQREDVASLLLTFVIPQDDVLFVIYTLPTVVISRRTDQYGKVRHRSSRELVTACRAPECSRIAALNCSSGQI